MNARPPVALFVYARPDHTQRTLDALAANFGAAETNLTVFCDGARGDEDRDRVEAVASVVSQAEGFRSVRIVRRDHNLGLANNIISGVSEVVKQDGHVIVLEDDIETATGFLDYMRAALDRFRDDDRVWHISGWLYEIERTGLPDYFLWSVMNCWGWATWADRWAHFERNPERIARDWDAVKRRRFNFDGAYDFYRQIVHNQEGRIQTWAIFWYATIFENDGLCLTPTQPFLRNIGLDGSGEHGGIQPAQQLVLDRKFEGLPHHIGPSPEAILRLSQHLAPSRMRKLARSIRRRVRRPHVDR